MLRISCSCGERRRGWETGDKAAPLVVIGSFVKDGPGQGGFARRERFRLVRLLMG
jgi:hypothetical protein